jgi:Protein of unknown function (DUF2891)
VWWWLACADPSTDLTVSSPSTGSTTLSPTTPPPPTSTPSTPPGTTDDAWEAFLAAREGYLLDLGEPILGCVQARDTPYPVFHGCVDWHSAVHGNWALHVLYRLTGDVVYLETAEAELTETGLQQELFDVAAGLVEMELPYGFAWFLQLAREREATTGAQDLVPLADEIYQQLAEYVEELAPALADAYVLSPEYENLPWAILQLWEQAGWNADVAEQERWEEYVRSRIVPIDESCLLEDDANSTGFFPPCLQRARAIAHVLPPNEAKGGLAEFVSDAPVLDPLTTFPTLHQAGQNFSRAWGLWSLWEHTGNVEYRDLYLDHVVTHMGMEDYWAENYEFYAHWVGQFGVYAIALSEE